MPYPDIEISRKDLSLATVHAGIVATASVVGALLYQGSDSSPLLRVANILIIVAVVYVYIRTGVPGIYRRRDSTKSMFRIEMMWFLFVYPLLYMFWVVLTFYISGLFLSRLTLLQSLPDGGGLLSFFLLSPVAWGLGIPFAYPGTGIFWCTIFSVAHGVGLLTDRWYPT